MEKHEKENEVITPALWPTESLNSSGGASMDRIVEARVARLETSVELIRSDVAEIKTDLRSMRSEILSRLQSQRTFATMLIDYFNSPATKEFVAGVLIIFGLAVGSLIVFQPDLGAFFHITAPVATQEPPTPPR